MAVQFNVTKPVTGWRTTIMHLRDPLGQMKALVAAGEPIRFSVDLLTKTQCSTMLECGNVSLRLNIPIDGFKMATAENHNFFSAKRETTAYFKKLKSQGLPEYLAYLEATLPYIAMQLGASVLEQKTFEVIEYHVFD